MVQMHRDCTLELFRTGLVDSQRNPAYRLRLQEGEFDRARRKNSSPLQPKLHADALAAQDDRCAICKSIDAGVSPLLDQILAKPLMLAE